MKEADLNRDVALQLHQARVRDRVRGGADRLLLYHGLGTGKTLSAIAAAEATGDPYVAAVPASLRPNFRGEIARHTDRSAPADVVSQTALARGAAPAVAPGTLIVDEAQNLRNPATAKSRAVADLARKADRVLLLSGTPIVNAPGDLAVPTNILAGTHFTPKSFEDRFVGTEREGPGLLGWLAGREPTYRPAIKNRGELERLLRGHVDYQPARTPEGVTVRDVPVEVEMDRDQDRFSRAFLDRLPWSTRMKLRWDYPVTDADLARMKAFLTGSREAGLSLYPFGMSDPGRAFEHSAKLRAAGEHLLAALKDPRKKALVYSNFVESGLKPYDAFLARHGIPHATFHGGLSDDERRRAVEDYNAGRIRALLLGPSAAEGISTKGTGLIQLLDPAWNESRLAQARGRGLRFDSHAGLPADLRDVTVERYLAHGRRPGWLGRLFGGQQMPTADEVLSALARRKEETNELFRGLLREVGSKEGGVVDDLKRARRASDRRNYPEKHRILRRLLESEPENFHVDSVQGHFLGLTHTASGFRLHLPRDLVPDAVRREDGKAAAISLATVAATTEGLRRRRRARPAPAAPAVAAPAAADEPSPAEVLRQLVAARRLRRRPKVADDDWAGVPAAVAARVKAGEGAVAAVQRALGGPSALTNALVYGTMGAGAGHLAGALAETVAREWMPPGSVEEGKGRRAGTALGAALGGLAWPAYRWSVALRAPGGPAAGDPAAALATAWPWRPEDLKAAEAALEAAIPAPDLPAAALKAAADHGGAAAMSGLFTPSIPVDAFNNAVWLDVAHPANPFGTRDPYGDNDRPIGTPPAAAAAASGAVAAAGAARGSGSVSPWDVALVAGRAGGAGWLGGLALGRTVGALAGLSPDAQRALRRAGLWGGLLAGAVRAAFGD